MGHNTVAFSFKSSNHSVLVSCWIISRVHGWAINVSWVAISEFGKRIDMYIYIQMYVTALVYANKCFSGLVCVLNCNDCFLCLVQL